MESIHKALHPLLEFTDALSGEEYVSISYLKPVLHFLATSVLAEDAEETGLTRPIKTKVLAYLNDKYSDPYTQDLLDVALFVDHRFKTQYISAENIPAIKTRLKCKNQEDVHIPRLIKILRTLVSTHTRRNRRRRSLGYGVIKGKRITNLERKRHFIFTISVYVGQKQ